MPESSSTTPNLVWVPLLAVALLAGIAMAIFNNSDAAGAADAESGIRVTWEAIDADPAQLCFRTTETFWDTRPETQAGEDGVEPDVEAARQQCADETIEFFGEGTTLGVESIEVLAHGEGTAADGQDNPTHVAVRVTSDILASETELGFVYLVVPMRAQDGEWLISGRMLSFDSIEEARGLTGAPASSDA